MKEYSIIRRGEVIALPKDWKPWDEANRFYRCMACGGYVDRHDLGNVLEHEGSLPHPAQDRVQ